MSKSNLFTIYCILLIKRGLMKHLLIVLLFLTNTCFGQKQVNYVGFDLAVHNPKITDYQGKWGINTLITNKETQEYILNRKSSEPRSIYGNNITINPDGTFVSGYSAPCGNDCFTSTTGKYKIIDENYICFYLENINHFGECSGNSEPNEDLGLFRIYKNENNLTLLRSDGNPESDKKNLQYIDLLTSKYQAIFEYAEIDSFMNWETTKRSLSRKEETAAFCMAQNQIKDYEFLYSKDFEKTTLILTKVKNEYRYILCEAIDNKTVRVALFDDSFFEKIDKFVRKMDRNLSLKKEILKEAFDYSNNPLEKNTIILYKQNIKAKKIIYNIFNKDISAQFVFYLQNDEPVYVYEKIIYTYGVQNKVTELSCYVSDWKKSRAAAKLIKQEIPWSFSGVQQTYYYLLEEVKKYNSKK